MRFNRNASAHASNMSGTTKRRGRQQEIREFDSYLHTCQQNLIAMTTTPAAFESVLLSLADHKVESALDVGCGIGQMLYPFVALRNAFGVGLDSSAQACRAGTDFYARYAPSARIRFVYGHAETLPFPDACFDVVNCGLALPYMNNSEVLSEIARVLRPHGVLFLSTHHLRYYLGDLWRGFRSGSLLQVAHAARALGVGAIYHATGRQPSVRLLGNETFQTRWLLQRELERRGLMVDHERDDSRPQAPAFVISKLAG